MRPLSGLAGFHVQLARLSVIFITAMVTLSCSIASANPAAARTFTLDGRLYNSTSLAVPLLDANVIMNVKIFDPSGTCLLYEEEQITSTYSTDGYFNVKVGSAPSNAKRAGSDPNNAMAQIFQNHLPIAVSGCPGYTPTSGDGRRIRITVSPSSGATEVLTPDIEMDSVPMAMVAESVQGLDRSKLLEMGTDQLTQTNVANVFSNTNYPKLSALLGGTSTDYVRVSGTTGAAMPSYAMDPASVAAGQVWLDTTSNQLKFHNGLSVQTISTGTMGASGITSLGGLTTASQNFAVGVAGTSPTFSSAGVTHTLNIPMASGAGVAGGLISKSDYDLFSNKLTPVLNTGYIFVGDGTNAAVGVLPSGDVSVNSAGVFSLATSGVTAGTYPKVEVDAKGRVVAGSALISTDIPGLAASHITAGTFDTTRLPSTVLYDGGNTIASGTLRVGTSSDHPLSLVTNGASAVTIGTNGYVGIGKAAPALPLDVAGLVNTSTGFRTDASSGTNVIGLEIRNTHTGTSGPTSRIIFQTSTTDKAFLTGGADGAGDAGYFGVHTRQSGSMTETLRINSLGRMGVGTIIPQTKLHVTGAILAGDDATCDNTKYGAIRVNSNTLQVCLASNTWSALSTSGATGDINNGGNTTGAAIVIGTNDNQALDFETNNVTRVTIGTNGNVGIGTASPASPLHVAGSSGGAPSVSADLIVQNDSTVGAGVSLHLAGGSTGNAVVRFGTRSSSPGRIFYGINTGAMAFETANSERMRIDSTGKVGIGTTSPSTPLEVIGTVKLGGIDSAGDYGISRLGSARMVFWNGYTQMAGHFQSTNAGGFSLRSGNSQALPNFSFFDDNDTGMYSAGSDNLGFTTAGSERVRINSAGNLGVGTTSPVAKLHVAGAILAGDDATCDNTKYGAIRVNSDNLQVCLGSNAWSTLSTGGATGTVTSIVAGAGLDGGTITTTGTISLATTGVTVAAYPKVTVDIYGRVVTGSTLSTSDIPSLDASKITSGTFLEAQIPALDAGKITSGTLASARLPANVILDAGNSTGGVLAIGTNDSQALQFKTNNTTSVTIGANGFVGIGTTTPSYPLHFYTPQNNNHLLYLIDSRGMAVGRGASISLGGISSTGGSITNFAAIKGMKESSTNSNEGGALVFSTRTNGTSGTTLEQRMQIDSYGNVAVGTTPAAVKLHVAGAILAGDDATCDNTKYGAIRVNSSNLQVCLASNAWSTLSTGIAAGDIINGGNTTGATVVVGTNDSQALQLETNNATRMTIGATGNVGIGTTTPDQILTVAGNIRATGAIVGGAATDADALSGITVDFSNTNAIRATGASAACGTLNVTNVTAGGMYNLTIPNATTTCSTIQLNGSTANVRLPPTYAAGAAVTGVVYSFLYDGTELWMTAVNF